MLSSSTATSTPTARAGARWSTCARLYGIEIGRAHDASADAIASIEVLFALAVRHGALWEYDLHHLHDDQIGWHQEWTHGYDAWRLSQGMVPIDPRDYVWPVAAGGAAGSLSPSFSLRP